MKSVTVIFLAFAAVLGMVVADYGYGYGSAGLGYGSAGYGSAGYTYMPAYGAGYGNSGFGGNNSKSTILFLSLSLTK